MGQWQTRRKYPPPQQQPQHGLQQLALQAVTVTPVAVLPVVLPAQAVRKSSEQQVLPPRTAQLVTLGIQTWAVLWAALVLVVAAFLWTCRHHLDPSMYAWLVLLLPLVLPRPTVAAVTG